MERFVKINSADNVAVVVAEEGLQRGDRVAIDGCEIELRDDIARGHKFALCDMVAGQQVVKYGYPIGHLTASVSAGEWVHSHNLTTDLDENLEYSYTPQQYDIDSQRDEQLYVDGYLRRDGQMGIRNELWIIPTVGCVNGQASEIARRIKQECDCSHIDDVRAYTHSYGCSQLGNDHANTQKALAAMACHPNAGGVLVLGLGCENNQVASLKEIIGEWDSDRVHFLVAQEVEDEVEEGVRLCRELVEKMRGDRREKLPLSLLRVGLKCGGSDGLSGITANPLVGEFSDWLIAQGGTTILTEVPEMFGAETILMNRAVNGEVFADTVQLINDFKEYFRSCGQPIYENPSPGNKAGGITPLEEKPLGCVQKGGRQPVVDVLSYGDKVKRPGLNLLSAPGNDLVASSALALSGCQMILFTTGRGTPFGSVVPTMKIATNSHLASFKSNWIDFNAGDMLSCGDCSAILGSFCAEVLAIASGKRVRHETSGHKELTIFKSGVTL